MRNRWMMILSNECPGCLNRNSGELAVEEIKLLRHVLRFGLVGAYLGALFSMMKLLPVIWRKRKWVRSRAAISCLPEYPIFGCQK
jgi:hypothetical protein